MDANRMKVITDSKKIEEVLTKGVEIIYPNKEALKKELLSGRRLRLYCGFDPSAPTLHIGNAIQLRKLGQFQKLGHEVIMLIGDFTGMIGDPTDKSAARKKLSRKEVIKNAKNYKKLASLFINFGGKNPAKILYNSKWNDKLSFFDLIEIASNFTVQQMIIRDMFQKRIEEKKPIFLHEFLYPVAQGYDSVAMDVDLEIGGNDQIFNMLCGRDLMKAMKNKEKFVLGNKLLADPTGKKMGKSEGNMVMLDEKPGEMYGKIMSWPDEVLKTSFEICTDLSLEEIGAIFSKGLSPRDLKAMLAREVVKTCHGEKLANIAEEEFNKIFRENALPTDIPEIKISDTSLGLLELLVKTKMASSKSEAKRLVLQKGVKIGDQLEDNWRKTIEIRPGIIIRVGNRKFIKIV